MTTIRQDVHGLVVLVGGYYARPIFPRGYSHVYKDGSKLQAGDKVKGRHRGGTPLITLTLPDGTTETWFSHGSPYGTGARPKSSDHFKPTYESWL